MDIFTLSGSAEEVAAALSSRSTGSFLSVHCNHRADVATLQATHPGAVMHGATSCLGAMTQAGVTDDVAAFVIDDPDGAYGTATQAFDGDPLGAAAAATRAALANADRVAEQPDLVWIAGTPGYEEEMLKGVESVLGTSVPILGGSAADNEVAGNWFIFDANTSHSQGVVVSVLFPSGTISFAYQNGYAPTANSGVVTKTDGRTVLEIDGAPAMDVYSDWTNGAVSAPATNGTTEAILSESTLFPLGRKVAEVSGVPYYLLAHPAGARANGEIDLFASVAEGEVLTCMTGTTRGLTERAGRVAELAKTAGRIAPADIKGALMIYCGGCMLTVRDTLSDVVDGVNDALGDAPFLGAFTFGEQGKILGSGNRHGNLMISCVVFAS